MAGEIASAFVRVRPDLHGFRAETEREVKGAFSGLGKLAAASAATLGIGLGVKNIVEAAAEEQTRAALLETTIHNAGASMKVFGTNIEDLIDKESRLKGFTDQDLSSALSRLVQATKNTGRATDDLSLAEDVSRIRKIGLGQAAIALAKAEQGSTTALARLGIIVPKVTAAQDALRASRDQAIAGGAKYSKQQDIEFKAAVAIAAQQDKESSRLLALNTVRDRFGGSAAKFATTAEGAFARTRVAVNELEESLGLALLPTITAGALGLADMIGQLQRSDELMSAVKSSGEVVASVFRDIKAVAETVGPPIATAAAAASHLVDAVGASTILAGIAAYKGLAIAQAAVTSAEATYQALKAKSAGVEAVSTAAKASGVGETTALTAALIANTAALEGNAGAIAQSTALYGARGEVLAVVTAETGAATIATGELAAAEVAAGAAGAGAAGKVAGLAAGLGAIASIGTIPVIIAVTAVWTNKGLRDRANDALASTLNDFPGGKKVADLLGVTAANESAKEADRLAAAVAAGKRTSTERPADLKPGFSFKDDKIPKATVEMARNLKSGADAAAKVAAAAATDYASTVGGATVSAAEQIKADQESLAKQIKDGNQQITDSINSAKQNLNSIGGSLAATIGEFLDKKAGGGDLPGKLSAEFKRLQDEIAAGGGGDELARKAAALASATNRAQSSAGAASQQRKDRITRQISDLTDEFNTYQITRKQLESRVHAILEREGVSAAGIQKANGRLAADTFKAQVTGIGDQADALAAGPRRPGAGLAPSIVRPNDTIIQVQRAEGQASRSIQKEILGESKRQTKELAKIAAQRKADVSAADFRAYAKRHPKAAKAATDLATAGATTP